MIELTREAVAYTIIKQKIIDAEFEPSSLISENELAVLLNMSRTPVRSALSQLAIEGFVKTYRNKGIMIVEIPLKDIVEMYGVLTALQLHILDLAQINNQEFDFQALKLHLDNQKEAAENKDFKAYYTHTLLFTRTIILTAQNEKMLDIIDSYTDKILARFISFRKYRKNSKPQTTFRNQEHIYESLIEGNFEEAKSEIRKYHKVMNEFTLREELRMEV